MLSNSSLLFDFIFCGWLDRELMFVDGRSTFALQLFEIGGGKSGNENAPKGW